MTSTDIFIVALGIGIISFGCWAAFLCRSEPGKALNILLLTAGILLAGHGHACWLLRHEAPERKSTVSLQFIIPGWALVTMGYFGLQRGGRGNGKDEP